MCDEIIKTTCLHDYHLSAGAEMTCFAGFDMPIQYKGIVEEHNTVRNDCGIFDVSHMGEIFISGNDAERFVNHIFTNDVTDMLCGKILYGMLLNDNGGTVDDLLVYRLQPNLFLLVVNASNIDKDHEWILSKKNDGDYDVEIENKSDVIGQIAVQGPNAEEVLYRVLGIDAEELGFYESTEIFSDEGDDIIVSRTGYTGEDGFEIYASPEIIRDYWEELTKKGVQPCGLGCRDTLRFEVGLPLYGDELSEGITPLEAGLGMFVKLDKEEFVGKEALVKQKTEGLKRKLVGLELSDKAIPRHGYEVLNEVDEVIGYVTTGYRCISVEKSVAMALIDFAFSAIGTEVKVKIRKKSFPAMVVRRQFYKKSYKQ